MQPGYPESMVRWEPGARGRLGHDEVLEVIGQGGMGTVYKAEQDSPRRTVALKVVRPGFASPAIVKRFNHEVQILGRLHHPGIAQVYEAGLADDGQPFFAMELIRGLPLDEYARRHGLDLAARAGLVARVADAVQHAHDQGVIHRDLKPANILVEETGQPKVLDFGVAHATGADLLTAAGLTRTGQLLGTPSYMSPEQVTADPAAVDRRADVYALGVILFELLARRLPYQLEGRPLVEVPRVILEQDPPRLGSLDRSLEEAAMDLGCDPVQAFVRVTLPLIIPAIAAGWMLAFTLSLDDVVIASFTTGPGSATLPIRIYSEVRLGVKPEINAICTMVIGLIAVVIVVASFASKLSSTQGKSAAPL